MCSWLFGSIMTTKSSTVQVMKNAEKKNLMQFTKYVVMRFYGIYRLYNLFMCLLTCTPDLSLGKSPLRCPCTSSVDGWRISFIVKPNNPPPCIFKCRRTTC